MPKKMKNPQVYDGKKIDNLELEENYIKRKEQIIRVRPMIEIAGGKKKSYLIEELAIQKKKKYHSLPLHQGIIKIGVLINKVQKIIKEEEEEKQMKEIKEGQNLYITITMTMGDNKIWETTKNIQEEYEKKINEMELFSLGEKIEEESRKDIHLIYKELKSTHKEHRVIIKLFTKNNETQMEHIISEYIKNVKLCVRLKNINKLKQSPLPQQQQDPIQRVRKREDHFESNTVNERPVKKKCSRNMPNINNPNNKSDGQTTFISDDQQKTHKNIPFNESSVNEVPSARMEPLVLFFKEFSVNEVPSAYMESPAPFYYGSPKMDDDFFTPFYDSLQSKKCEEKAPFNQFEKNPPSQPPMTGENHTIVNAEIKKTTFNNHHDPMPMLDDWSLKDKKMDTDSDLMRDEISEEEEEEEAYFMCHISKDKQPLENFSLDIDYSWVSPDESDEESLSKDSQALEDSIPHLSTSVLNVKELNKEDIYF